MTTPIEFKAWLDSPLTKALKQNHKEAVKAERERIFGVLLDMHDKTQGTHNYYIHAVQHIRARGNT
jgi:macrodomain Ter protein organizer (MatP/YcbG family)